MINLIIDTNTWVYMANGFNQETSKYENGHHHKIVEELREHVQQGKIKLIVNEIIIKEWARNKDAQEKHIVQLQNRINTYKSQLKSMAAPLSKKGKRRAKKVFQEAKVCIEAEIKKSRDHISAVEDLLKNKSEKIPVKDSHRIEASKLAEDKKAPFHNKNNSINDAIILLSAVDYFKDYYSEIDWTKTTYFISNNSDDYCIKKGVNQVHPDLEKYFQEAAIVFESNIGKALKMGKDTIVEIEEYFRYIDSLEQCESNCKGVEYGLGDVPYSLVKVPVLDKVDKHIFDPNQVQLAFPNQAEITEEEVLALNPSSHAELWMGDCNFCGMTHVKCECEEVHLVYSQDQEVECDCGRTIVVKEGEIEGVYQNDSLEEEDILTTISKR